tara:strand:- start:65 stop:559 length:495 start_codon:yes stop_codon:yes gene_type:complete
MSLSRSDLFSSNLEKGTPELQRKHRVVRESIDLRGLMTRSRVEDQCQIDKLFLEHRIDAPQHSAGECMMDVLTRAGGWPRSADLEALHVCTLRDAESSIGSRIMAASGALTALRRVSDAARNSTIIVIWRDRPISPDRFPDLREGLDALVRHFRTGGVRDPRAA